MNKSNFSPEEEDFIQVSFQELLKQSPSISDREDIRQVQRAFAIAHDAHRGYRRKSGEPFILHPIEVARIASTRIGLGATSIIAALLHDSVEDTALSLEDVKENFGEKVAFLVDGLTKWEKVLEAEMESARLSEEMTDLESYLKKFTTKQAENYKKLIFTLADDVRVILIKFADRLHNMRTLGSMEGRKQTIIAAETLFIFAPLAQRLGLYSIKTDLEDLSFKFLQPSVYSEIKRKLEEKERRNQDPIRQFIEPVQEVLQRNQIRFTISGRHKSVYSIYRKMEEKVVPFEEIYDLYAIRIVFEESAVENEKPTCWLIYTLITELYTPNPARLRDWVTLPKANGYQALHVTVMGKDGNWIEVQIRSTRMEEIAERGYAAHYKYKNMQPSNTELDNWLSRISKELAGSSNYDALDFLDTFRYNLFAKEIIVFTRTGEKKTLPKGSTVLDFAFDIHRELGYHCIGAKVNHKVVGRDHRLHSGDQVEILTITSQKPQLDWLKEVVTSKARQALKEALVKERKLCVQAGHEILDARFSELKQVPDGDMLKKILVFHNLTNKEELYYQLGSGGLNLNNLKEILQARSKKKTMVFWTPVAFPVKTIRRTLGLEKERKNTLPTLIQDVQKRFEYQLAPCCDPLPGDEVFGHKQGIVIVIHRNSCERAIELAANDEKNICSIRWTQDKLTSHLAQLYLKGQDRHGLLHDVTSLISGRLGVNMRSANMETRKGQFTGQIDIYIHNRSEIESLVAQLRKINGIHKVDYTTTQPEETDL